MREWFIRRRITVARPVAVKSRTCVPSSLQRKCSSKRSTRGLKREVASPVSRSSPVRNASLNPLQPTQVRHRLSAVVGPPRDSAMLHLHDDRLRRQAVFTASARPLDHLLAQRWRDVRHLGPARHRVVTYPPLEAGGLALTHRPQRTAFGLPRWPKPTRAVKTAGPGDLMTRFSRVRPVGSDPNIGQQEVSR